MRNNLMAGLVCLVVVFGAGAPALADVVRVPAARFGARHAAAITSLAVSPDGHSLVTGGTDGNARLWDADTGRELGVFNLAGTTFRNPGSIRGCAFVQDGAQLLVAWEGGVLSLFDIETGAILQTLYIFNQFTRTPNYCLAVSPDGLQAITGNVGARVWDLRTGERTASLRADTDVEAVAYSSDGTLVATGLLDGTVKLWSGDTLAEVRTIAGHTDGITSVAFSSDASLLLTASMDQTAKLWNTATGALVREFSGHTGAVTSAVFSADSMQVVTGSEDATVRRWNASDGTLEATLQAEAPVDAIAVTPDGTRVMAGLSNGNYQSWSLASGSAEPLAFVDIESRITAAAFRNDEVRAVTGDLAGAIQYWNLERAAMVRSFQAHDTRINDIAISGNGALLVTGSEDGTARLWDMDTATELKRFAGDGGSIDAVEISGDGTRILTLSLDDQSARLWNADTGEALRTFQVAGYQICCAALSVDGSRVLTGHSNFTAYVWSAETGQRLATLEGYSTTPVFHKAAFSHDGQRALLAASGSSLAVWSTVSGAQLQVCDTSGNGVRTVAFSRDDRWAMAVYDTGLAYVYDTATGGILRALNPNTSTGTCGAISAQGTRAVTAASRSMFLWDLEQPVVTLTGDSILELECGTEYSEPGFQATDLAERDITLSVKTGGDSLDTAQPGETYRVTYDVTDAAGHAAAQVVRKVVITEDTEPPVITLLGEDPLVLVCGAPLVDPGATALDPCEGSVAVAATGGESIDTSIPGEYEIVYTAADSGGLEAEPVVRSVIVSPCQTGDGEGTVQTEGEGTSEGAFEGVLEGTPEGQAEGTVEGSAEGSLEGVTEGEGSIEGHTEGEGAIEGTAEGEGEGAIEGAAEGEGSSDGEGTIDGEGEPTTPTAGCPGCRGADGKALPWDQQLGDWLAFLFGFALMLGVGARLRPGS